MKTPPTYHGGDDDLDPALLAAADFLDPPIRGAAIYRNNPVGFVQDCIRWQAGEGPTDYQCASMSRLIERKRLAKRAPHGAGKDLDVATPLPTPDGWTTMGAVNEGDPLFDEHGIPCRVRYAETPQIRDAYLVTFSDSGYVVAGAGHLWNAIDINNRPRRIRDWRDRWDLAKTVTTEDIARCLRTAGGRLSRWRIPTARPLDLPDADLPIDPYLFGYWLGNGSAAGQRARLMRDPHARRSASGMVIPPRTGRLRALGVLGNKHIPLSYLRASIPQRRELVRGLWDADGYTQKTGRDEFTCTEPQLAYDTAELLRSLGLLVRVAESRDDISRRWRISARFDFRPYGPDRYEWAPRSARASQDTQRTIVDITPAGKRLTRCIAVDSPSRLFLAGSDMIPTHNTSENAWLVIWWALTRDALGVDWKAITTASAWRQLDKFLWPEIHKWVPRLDWEKIARRPFDRRELMKLSLQLRTGEAFAAACEDPAKIEGAHADHLLFIYDEAKAVPAATFDACEGAFAGAGADTRQEALALASSTPGPPEGRFYDIHDHKPGLDDWDAMHITLDQCVTAGRVSREWANRRRVQWGATSAVYLNRVLGEFAESSEDGIIPLPWVEAAIERWKAWNDLPHDLSPDSPHSLDAVGVDVGGDAGGDHTEIALRHGHVITEIRDLASMDTMQIAGEVLGICLANHHPAKAISVIVDTIGVGAGVYARLTETCHETLVSFKASEKTDRRDRSRELGFANKRAAAWWNLRELLDPSTGSDVCLPDNDQMVGELIAPRWNAGSDAKIKVESKRDIRSRLGRSTDAADAVMQSFWPETGFTVHAPVFAVSPSPSRWNIS